MANPDVVGARRHMVRINVAKDFSEFPAGRFRTDGPYSGERFRDDVLAPALRRAERIVVALDGTMGYGSSFLEEAFGGLLRIGFNRSELKSKLSIECSDRSHEAEIWDYIDPPPTE